MAVEHGALSYREFPRAPKDRMQGEQVADMSLMRYGGFETFVSA